MKLPRGRRWVDKPGKPWPAPMLAKMQEAVRLGFETTTPINDPLAERDRIHAASIASERKQGELVLVSATDPDA